MKVLIIDDDALVAISLKTILESDSDIEVVAVGNSGEEAIELYPNHKPDVLLMDIRMSGMTGLEAGEKILAQSPDARILYLTTFMDDEYIDIIYAIYRDGNTQEWLAEYLGVDVSTIKRNKKRLITKIYELLEV